MASTTRLPPALKAEAQSYADSLGISLNALLSVALRDYLDLRAPERRAPSAPRPPLAPDVPPSPAARVPSPAQMPAPARALSVGVAKVGPNQPCPCGSGQKYKRCHGRP